MENISQINKDYITNSKIKNRLQRFFIEYVMLLPTILLIIFGIFSSKYFLTILNIQNLLISISIIGLLSLGAMFVMIFGEIDLSVGYLMVFSFFVSIKLQSLVGNIFDTKILIQGTIFNGSQIVLAVGGILIACLIGLINGLGVVYGRINSFIMTLGMMGVLNGANFVLSKGKSFFLSRAEEFIKLGDTYIFKIIPLMTIVYIGIVISALIFLKLNVVGLRIYSVGSNRRAAMLAGINTKLWVIISFALSGFLAGIAGMFFQARSTFVDPKQGGNYAILAIAIAALGGTTLEGGEGNPLKVFIACLFLGTLLNILIIHGISGWFQTAIVGVIIIVGFILNNMFKNYKNICI